MDACIDEVSIYDRALTQEEVEALFLAGCKGECENDHAKHNDN